MAWNELGERRIRQGRTYQDAADPTLHRGHFTLAPLHYESEIDSGVFDAEIDCTPIRVQGPALDGWRITANGWHYALGQPGDKLTDGWVGFGGRQGAHWLQFRIVRAGYLHAPTRAWQDVGGAPTYDRANLTRNTTAKVVGPNDELVAVESVARWDNLWSTPGPGRVGVRWRINGDQLKEEITIDQVARQWITANRPPATPATETFFGFVVQVDWSDIPRVYLQSILQDVDTDFSADDQPLELRDALDRLLAFLPIDHVVAGVPGHAGGGVDRQPLHRRFWKDPDGNHYLLIGVRCDVLAGMRSGPLTFDPTFNIAATNRDGSSESGWSNVHLTDPAVDAIWGTFYVGYESGYFDGAWAWTTTIEDAPTITAASVFVDRLSTDYSAGWTGDWYGFDVDAVGVFVYNTAGRISDHAARTTALVADDSWASADHTSPSLTAIVQEICDRAGVGANPVIGLTYRPRTTAAGWYNWSDYSDSAANAADLTVTWTTGGGTEYEQAAAGAITPAGAETRRTGTGKGGALAPGGALSRQAGKAVAGALGLAGAVVRQAGKAVAGALGLAGALGTVKTFLRSVAGVLGLAGTETRQTGTGKAGSLGLAGTETRQTGKGLAGSLGLSGAQARLTAKSLVGALGLAGAIARQAGKALAGILGLSGTLGTIKTFLRSVAGTLGLNGGLSRRAGKAAAGTLGLSGVPARLTAKSLVGALGLAGAIARQAGKTLAGNLGLSGALSSVRTYLQAAAGVLGFSGILSRGVRKAAAGTLTPGGALSRQVGKATAGTLNMAGGLARRIGKAVSGVISWLGSLASQFSGERTPVVAWTLRSRSTAWTLEER